MNLSGRITAGLGMSSNEESPSEEVGASKWYTFNADKLPTRNTQSKILVIPIVNRMSMCTATWLVCFQAPITTDKWLKSSTSKYVGTTC